MELKLAVAYLAAATIIRGKKALQKLVYFLQEAGIPLGCTFSMHLYGPYSNEVAQEYDELVALEILHEAPLRHDFEPGAKCRVYLEEYGAKINPHKDKLDRIIDLLGQFPPMELEMYATTHFIATALFETYETSESEKIIREVRQAKGAKFSDDQIRKALDDMENWGLLAGKGDG